MSDTAASSRSDGSVGGDGSPVVTNGRAWRHLLVSTPWLLFYTAAYAYSLFWIGGFLAEMTLSRSTYYALRAATFRWDVLLAYWLGGIFLPTWFVFSFYGFWLRQAQPGHALPSWLERTLAWGVPMLLLLPWWWPVFLVRDPRLVLRNYRRRFLGETLFYMDEAPPDATS